MNTDNPPAQGKGVIDTVLTDGDEDFERWQRTAVAAFFRAEARGFTPGHELDDWLTAERELAAVPAAEKALEVSGAIAPSLDAAGMSKQVSARAPQATAVEPSAKSKRVTRARKTKPGSETRLGGMA